MTDTVRTRHPVSEVAAPLSVAFTFAEPYGSDLGEEHITSLEELARDFQAPHTFQAAALVLAGDSATKYGKPKELGAFVLGRFREGRRSRDTFTTSDAVAIEFDGTWTLTEARDALARAGLGALMYTTFNHQHDGTDRFRLLVPTSRSIVSADEYDATWARLNEVCEGRGDKSARDAARFWFFPGVVEGRPYACELWPGARLQAVAATTTLPRVERAVSPPVDVEIGHSEEASALMVAGGLRSECPTTGKRHAVAGALAAVLVRDDLIADDSIPAFVERACVLAGFGALTNKRNFARETVRKFRSGAAVTGWPTLDKEHPQLASVVRVAFSKPFAGVGEAATFDPVASAEDFSTELDADAPLPPMQWLVDGLIQRASVAMFVAHGGSLKTWIALSIMLAVKRGRRWLGFGGIDVTQADVLLLDYESGPYEVQRRIQILDQDAPRPRIRYKWQPGSLHDPATWERVEKDISAHGIALCVIDSLSGGSGTEDENTPAFAQPLKLAAEVSERTGCAFLFIHHARKGEGAGHEMIRGSTAIHAACDVVFRFSDVRVHDEFKSTEMIVLKPGPGPQPKPVKVKLSDSRGLELDAGASVHPAERMRLDIVRRLERGPASQNEIEIAVPGRAEDKRKALKALVEDGGAVIIGRKYQIDSDDRRLKRVLAVLEESPDTKGRDLLRRAYVKQGDLDRMVERKRLAVGMGSMYFPPCG